ncbi:MAG: alpha/beta hydrolase [Myxococcales bacterium]|jgi:alpha-beta hydrolase superfamily lysophospholipase
MQSSTFNLTADDGTPIHVYRWAPDGDAEPRAVVQIAHGMAEHGGRYAPVAEALTAAGYLVYADDHRGHGVTAGDPSSYGYFAPEHGWRRVVEDLHALNRHIASEHPGLPRFLLGHSMGSFMTQTYLYTHGDSIDGAILSGSSAPQAAAAIGGRGVAYVERLRLGPKGHSALLQRASIGEYNRRFKPNRTDADWLSREPAEVDKYLADPACGFDMTVQGWIDLFDGMLANADADNLAKVPASLPIYIFSGSQDPVGRFGAGVRAAADMYRKAGVTDLSVRLYEGGRHEMFNETNRDEVCRDLIDWLDATLDKRAAQAERAARG